MHYETKKAMLLLLGPPTAGLIFLDLLSVTGQYDLFDKISSISQTQLLIAVILTFLAIAGTIIYYKKARDSENNNTTKLDKSFKILILCLTLATLPLLFINYNTYFNYKLDIVLAAVLGISIIVGIVFFYKTYKTYDDASQAVSETKKERNKANNASHQDTSDQTPTSLAHQSKQDPSNDFNSIEKERNNANNASHQDTSDQTPTSQTHHSEQDPSNDFSYSPDIALAANLGSFIIAGIELFYKTYKTYNDANLVVSETETNSSVPNTPLNSRHHSTHAGESGQPPTSPAHQSEKAPSPDNKG